MQKSEAPGTGESEGGGGRVLACAACGQRITRDSARIEVGGQHRHLCVNPSGVAFDIACFALAPGCVPLGPRQRYWTWFPGHAWQVERCAGCQAHLGWSFHGDIAFYGLIAPRLVPLDEQEG